MNEPTRADEEAEARRLLALAEQIRDGLPVALRSRYQWGFVHGVLGSACFVAGWHLWGVLR